MAEPETIRLAEGWAKAASVGDWTVPGEPAFAESEAFNRLLRDLRLYVRDEIAGRSFLIAGHRGAGKTTTVVQAVRRLRTELLSNSANPEEASLGRRHRLQRPLIVKLVGKSLLEAPPRQKEIEQQKQLHRQAELARLREAGHDVPAEAGAPTCTEKPGGLAENALVHITIALYRAFAAEVALAYAAHAAADPADRRNRMELASQLALELDNVPEPGLLRAYWDQLGRFDNGVLWPARADQTMEDKGLRGQGAREIVAVATAAQAFQVCSGAIFHKVSSEEVASHEQTAESKVDWKEVVNRVATLGAGALAGSVVGIGEGRAVAGVATGILVWLASGVALNWSSTRKRRREQKLDYAFLRDRSIQTLDRDLPLVIERIREAGLAPVFVIDELDKLDRKDALKNISDIIDRLKHLVADYGFFCFLTDRDYFEEIERTVSEEAYPTQHTYFSQRLLVLNRSTDLLQYLRTMLKADGEIADERKAAIDTFALAMIFRSRLNFADLNRILARFIRSEKDGDRLAVSEAELLRPGELKLAATVQLAIDQVVLDLDLATRFNADVAFEQLAIDALYYIPRCWEDDVKAPVDIGRDAIKECLLKRMPRDKPAPKPVDQGDGEAAEPEPVPRGTPDPGNADEASDEPILASDLDDLTAIVGRLADYLANFNALFDAVAQRGKVLASIVLTPKRRLLVRDGALYRFTLDTLADELTPPAARERSPARAPTDEPPQDFLLALRDLLQMAGVSVADLVAGRLLPPTVSDELLSSSIDDLAAAATDATRLARGLDGRLAFAHAIGTHGRRLAEALVMLVQVRHDAQSGDSLALVLAKIARHFRSGEGPLHPRNWEPPLKNLTLNGTAGSVIRLKRRFEAFRKSPRRRFPLGSLMKRGSASWTAWHGYLVEQLTGDRTAQAPFDYADFVLAAQGRAPGSLFRADIGEMDAIDWSKVVIAGFPDASGVAGPTWLIFAALRALDFDAEAMAALARAFGLSAEGAGDPVIDRFIRSARARPRGVLYVYSDAAPPIRPFTVPRARPILAVGYSELRAYMGVLDLFATCGLFEGGMDGTEE